MTQWHRFTQMVHLVALGLWLGTVVMSSAAAAIIFPTVRSLNPHVPAYAQYEGEHWLLVAGMVAERIFAVGDMIQFPCAMVAAVTLGLLVAVFRHPRLRASMVLRILGLTVAIGALASQLFIVAPAMNASIGLYRAAALAGDTVAARTHQEAFSELHPIARTIMATTLVSVLVALGAAAWGAGPAAPRGGAPGGTPSGPASPRLEEPRLLRGLR